MTQQLDMCTSNWVDKVLRDLLCHVQIAAELHHNIHSLVPELLHNKHSLVAEIRTFQGLPEYHLVMLAPHN